MKDDKAGHMGHLNKKTLGSDSALMPLADLSFDKYVETYLPLLTENANSEGVPREMTTGLTISQPVILDFSHGKWRVRISLQILSIKHGRSKNLHQHWFDPRWQFSQIQALGGVDGARTISQIGKILRRR